MKGKTTAAGMGEPTDEQIIRVLAEFEGWSDFWEADQGGRHWLMGMHAAHAADYYALENERIELPDYLNDLNAMRIIENELERRELKDEYIDALGPFAEPDYNGPLGYDIWRLLHATARQRALAAYRTITEQEGKGQ